nr:hypothetical protein [uncultured Anaerocolumna sp.]
MKYEAYFNEFCKVHGYTGKYKYNSETDEYDIIISKDGDNAGAFLDEDEYQSLTIEELQGTLELLHKGFKAKFNR